MGIKGRLAAKISEKNKEGSISRMRKNDFSQSVNFPVDHILHLHRTIGNQAVQRLLKSGFIQAMLRIGQLNDIYEEEADRVAEQAMRMPASAIQPKFTHPFAKDPSYGKDKFMQPKPLALGITPFIQRQMEEKEEILRSKGASGQTSEDTSDIESNINSLRGGGQPLLESGRAFFEKRFGQDFSQARVHTDTRASGSVFIQAKPERHRASKIIPDLDDSTVEEMKSLIRFGMSKKIRQELIDFVVQDRQGKGDNFQIMEKGKPIYVDPYPSWVPEEYRQSNGITLLPGQELGCPGSKPCVFIGATAFGGSEVEERIVRLYSSIMHEYQHAKQWQKPESARELGKAGRDVEAFFWEIENSKRTGLFGQRGPFEHVWNEAKRYWEMFKKSPEWQKLKNDEKQRYIDWFQRISRIAGEVMGARR